MNGFNLNKEKALHSILFIINNLKKVDAHKLYKILYFADKKHLVNYGRTISGDTYVKMQYGPVPSFIKNIVDEDINNIFEKERFYIKTEIRPDLTCLSESDIECLTESIQDNKDNDFATLTKKSHDAAYHNTDWFISFLDMAKDAGANKEALSYIEQQAMNDNIVLQ